MMSEMGDVPCPSSVVPGLFKYLVPAEETYCGEYVYRMPLELKKVGAKQGGTKKGEAKFKYEVEKDFKIILSALLNTSGGIIQLVPQIPQKPLGDKDFDEWLNRLKVKLNFIPVDIYHRCISVHVESGEAYIMVNKANQFITVNSHLHSREVAGNIQIQHYSAVSRLVSSSTESTSITTPLIGPFIHGDKCPILENQHLEFKHYVDQSGVDEVDLLIDKLSNERELKAIFGMANLTGGGDIVLGISEDPSTKTYVYMGQRLSVSRQSEFKVKLQELLEKETNRKHIWGSRNIVPKEDTHWSCKFIPVQMASQSDTTCQVLIVIHLFHCPGGAFLDTPEAYSLNDDGDIELLGFEYWQLMHTGRKISTNTSLSKMEPLENMPAPLFLSDGPGEAAQLPEITPDSIFQDNTSVCYTKHSSSWEGRNGTHHPPNTVQHPEVIDLFKIGDQEHSIRYNPSRESLHWILTNRGLPDFLPTIESTLGELGFGIAGMLWNCLKHSCTETTPPPDHVLDVLIVTESASMILAAAAVPEYNTASTKSLNAYKVRLARILKRRMLECMSFEHSTEELSRFMIDCQLSKPDGSPKTCPDFIMDWFTGSSFQEVCSALANVMKSMNTCFRDLISRDEDLCLSAEQMDILMRLEPNRFSIVEGPPGCGKTVLARLFTASKGRDAAAYISASKALTNRAKANSDITAFYAKDSEEILSLLETVLKDCQHMVIDDHHRYRYTEDQLHELCRCIKERKQCLYVFQDSKFQNFLPEMTNKFKSFLIDHEEAYGSAFTKTMNIIRRNSQVVGSFIRTQILALQSGETEVECASPVNGDDITIKQMKNLWENDADNGLLKHVQGILKPSIASDNHHYTCRDIAILVDDKNVTAEDDVTLFRSILERKWPVQSADKVPVERLIVDTHHNFMGLESRVVLFVLARENMHQFQAPSQQTELHQTKYRIAVASRALDRVDFLQESNLDGRIIEEMKCDLCPRNALKVAESSSLQRRREKKRQEKAEEQKKDDDQKKKVTRKENGADPKPKREKNDNDSSESEAEDFDQSAAFFTQVVNKKKKPGPGPEPLSTAKSKTEQPKTTNDSEEQLEDLDPVVLRSRQLAIEGNKMANVGQYQAAIELFTEAVRLDPRDFRFFGNRSFCFDRMQQYEKALKDAEKAIQLAPDWPKGYFRKGRALAGLKRNADAEQSFMQVLKLDRNCEDAMTELHRVRTHQLTEMGFSQQQAQNAIRQYDSVQQALDSLLAGGMAETSLASEVYMSDEEDYSGLPATTATTHHPPPTSHLPITMATPGSASHHKNNDIKMDPANPEGLTALWVGNVLPEVTEKKLNAMFSKYGLVTSVRPLPEKYCAFVNFKTKEAADAAMKNLQGVTCAGQQLLIKFPDNPITNGNAANNVVIRKGPAAAKPQPASFKQAVAGGKASGPVNGNECYFWRTTGCTYGKECHYAHIPANRGVDKKPWQRH